MGGNAPALLLPGAEVAGLVLTGAVVAEEEEEGAGAAVEEEEGRGTAAAAVDEAGPGPGMAAGFGSAKAVKAFAACNRQTSLSLRGLGALLEFLAMHKQ